MAGVDPLEQVGPIDPSALPDASERRLHVRLRRYHAGAPRVRGREVAARAGQENALERQEPTESLQQGHRREDDVRDFMAFVLAL